MTTLLERLKIFLVDKKLSIRNLEEKIDASYGTISRPLNKGTTFSYVFLEKIFQCFPELNTNWLMRGEGEMYNTLPTEIKHDLEKRVLELESVVKELKQKSTF